jgi:tetratricopeptide (TPR) repeat protein
MNRLSAAAAALLACVAAVSCSRGSSRDSDGAASPPAATAPAAVQPLDASIALFEKRTAADPRDHLSATTLAELHLRRAAESLDSAEFAAAERAARTALEREPGHPPAIVALALAAAGQGRGDEARRSLDELLVLQPRNVPALGAAFDVALAAGDVRIARSLADRLLAINEEPGTLSRMAQIAEQGGDVDRATALWRRAADAAADLGALPDEKSEYPRRAGWALLTAKRPDDAAREFDAALAANPRDAEALRGRAEILAARGRSADATAAMESAVAVRPTPEYRARLDALRAAGGPR